MRKHLKLTAVVLLLLATGSLAFGAAETTEKSGESYWGEIPPESTETTRACRDNVRPFWENCIYYPYQVVAWPVRTFAGGIGSIVTWASEPDVHRTIVDIVTLDFLPVQGRIGVSAGGGDGYGATYSLTHDNFMGRDNRMKFGLGYMTEGKSKATLGFLFGDGHPNSTSFGLGYRLKSNARYFGPGYDSLEDMESYYTSETAWLGGAYTRSLGANSFVELSGLYSTAATRGPRDHGDETLEGIFGVSAGIPFGYGEQSDGYTLGFGLRNDTTGENGRPMRGGIRQAKVTAFTATDDSEVTYWCSRFEMQQFLPLWHTRRTLALRAVYSDLHNTGDYPIPFQRLMTNDDPDLFRGFRDQRFRDEGIVAFSAEYRFPTWNYKSIGGLGVDAYLFYDYGQVFDESREISMRNMSESWGGGFRYISKSGFGGRLEIGLSDEATVFRFGASQTFQFDKGGLLHGRNPIPSR